MKLILVFLCSFPAFAASLCVTESGAGAANGADWSNALPKTFTAVRGNTYYLADGTAYGSKTFSVAVSGSTAITIKKAIAGDHVTDTGWTSGMGDGEAVFSKLTFTTSYWTVDGQTGGGPGSWNTGHGIRIEQLGSFPTNDQLIYLDGTLTGLEFLHLRLNSNRDQLCSGIKGTTGVISNIHVAYCSMTDLFGVHFHMTGWTGLLSEYNYFKANHSTPDWHSESVSVQGTSTDCTFRWSIYDQIEGTAIWAGINPGECIDWKIYGNIMARSTTVLIYYYEADPSINKNRLINALIANNTLYLNGPVSVGNFFWQFSGDEGNHIVNNLYYTNLANLFVSPGIVSHNWSLGNVRPDGPFNKDSEVLTGDADGQIGTGDPFISYNADPLLANLGLSADTEAGLDTTELLPENSVDMNGITRTTFSRGALQFVAGSPSEPVAGTNPITRGTITRGILR